MDPLLYCDCVFSVVYIYIFFISVFYSSIDACMWSMTENSLTGYHKEHRNTTTLHINSSIWTIFQRCLLITEITGPVMW